MAAKIPAAGVDLDGAITINESSADADFRIETNGNANMFVVDGGNDAVIFNGSTSNFASGSQVVQVYNSGLSFTSGYGIQGGANTDRASVTLTSGASGHIVFKANNSEVARFTTDGLAIGGTGAANTLGDYEEGVYNPTLTDSAGNVTSITLNSSFDTLAYTKVGRKVTVGGAIVVSSFSGSWGSGQCQVSLPFVVANLSEAAGRQTGTVGAYQVDFTAGTAPYLITSEGQSYCVIQTSGDNSTGGTGQPTNSAQLYIGLTYFTT